MRVSERTIRPSEMASLQMEIMAIWEGEPIKSSFSLYANFHNLFGTIPMQIFLASSED